jgi:hypothetical protein
VHSDVLCDLWVRLLSEQIGVRAGAGEQQLAAFLQVNQNPVWLDVAVAIPLPLAAKRMVLCLGSKGW